jgi:signal transduction histidine kinase
VNQSTSSFMSLLLAGLAFALGLIVLLGWVTAEPDLIRLSPDLTPMAFSTALGLVLSGTALWLLHFRQTWATAVTAGCAFLLGLVVLAQYLLDLHLDVEAWLMPGDLPVSEPAFSIRMAQSTAVVLILCGAALQFGAFGLRSAYPAAIAVWLGLIVSAIALVAVSGYLLRIETAYSWGQLNRMAPHTATGFLLVGASITLFRWPLRAQQEVNVTRLQRHILLFSAIGSLTIVLLAGVVGLLPVYAEVRRERSELLPRIVRTEISTLREFLRRVESITNQISERTHARELLMAHNRGEIGHERLRKELTTILSDALRGSDDLDGLMRFDMDGHPVASVGLKAEHEQWLEHAFATADTRISGPWKIGDNWMLLASSQIVQPGTGSPIGRDLALIRMSGVEAILRETPQLGETGRVGIGFRAPQGIWCVTASGQGEIEWSPADPVRKEAIERALAGETGFLDSEGRLRAFAPLPGTPWVVIAGMDKSELFAALDRQMALTGVAVLMLLMFGAVGMHRVLRPLTGGVLLHADSLQRRINEATREVADAHRVLGEKHRELERFSYVVSHDLQAPLRSITGFAQLLERRYQDKLDDEGREFLQYIVDSAALMRRMISDILALSRVDSGEMTWADVDTDKLVEGLRTVLHADLEASDAKLEHERLPTVQGDERQLAQLFQNLIGNAIKFCPKERSPVVRISAERSDGGWHFQVSDNGIGIPADKLDKLFGLFVRLDGADEYPGTGLGLAICKRIIERHSGRIWVESEQGHGTTFHFVLAEHPTGQAN